MTQMQPKSIRNLGVYGVIRQAEVDDSLIPEGAVTEAVNFHFDKKGVATVRPGSANLGGTSVIGPLNGNMCVGLFNHRSSNLIAAFYDTRGSLHLYLLGAGGANWADFQTIPGGPDSSLGGTRTTAKVRFVDFDGYVAMLIGIGMTQAIQYSFSTDASNSLITSSSNGLFNIPSSDVDIVATSNLLEYYKSRLYMAGTVNHASRLYFSSVVDVSGRVTWTPSIDYVDINPGDGEDIVSIKRYSLELVVLKPNYTYRFRTSGLDPDPLIKIGTRSHESVVEGKRGLYFCHDTGFYRYSGGYPEEISRPIIDIIKAIPFTQLDDVIGWTDGYSMYWSLGNLAIGEGNTIWKNVVVRYTESSDVWTIYSYPYDIRRAVPYITKTSSSIAIGLDNGSVGLFNQGLTDTGEPIKFRLITPWYEWEGIENRKIIQTIITLAEKGMGSNLMYQINNEQSNWNGLNNDLRNPVTVFTSLGIEFNRIRFKIVGVTTSESPIFRGLEIPNGLNQGFVKQWLKS